MPNPDGSLTPDEISRAYFSMPAPAPPTAPPAGASPDPAAAYWASAPPPKSSLEGALAASNVTPPAAPRPDASANLLGQFPGAPPAAPPSPPASTTQHSAPPPLSPPPAPMGAPMAPIDRSWRELPMPTPTKAEDAAFEAYKASLAAKPAPTAAKTGPVKAAAANPDPYGTKAAQKALLGTYDESAEAARRSTVGEGDKNLAVGLEHAELARRQQEDAAIATAENDFAKSRFDADIAEIGRQLDDLKTEKINPRGIYQEEGGTALAVSAIVGGVLGGLYMGATRSQENPFLRDLNRQIDRYVSAQEKALDTKKAVLGEKMSLLGQQRAVFKDSEVAKQATRAMLYQAAEQQILGEAARYDSPIYQARADAAVAEIARARADVDLKFKTAAEQRAAAAAAAAHAKDKEVFAMYREVYDKALGHAVSAGNNPQQAAAFAEAEAKRQIGVVYAPSTVHDRAPAAATVDPLMSVPKDLRSEAAKELQAAAAADKGVAALGQVFAKWKSLPATSGPWDRDRSALSATAAGAYKGALGPGMSSDKDFETFIAPNLPTYGDSDATLAKKQANINQTIRSKVATPILDRYGGAPTAPAPVQRYDANGKPK